MRMRISFKIVVEKMWLDRVTIVTKRASCTKVSVSNGGYFHDRSLVFK